MLTQSITGSAVAVYDSGVLIITVYVLHTQEDWKAVEFLFSGKIFDACALLVYEAWYALLPTL